MRAKAARRAEVRGAPRLPEIDNDREHGPGVQHDQQQSQLRRRRVQPHQFFRHYDVGGARYGQQLRRALNDGQEGDLPEVHARSTRGSDSELYSICGRSISAQTHPFLRMVC